MEELINTGQSDVVGRLAFKYMEMCKVDSSSDSESETSPRWSDVSSKGFEISTPENRAASKKLQRLSGQTYQQCLNPYDGSSEDSSNSSTKGPKRPRQGSFRMKGRGRRSCREPRNSSREMREAGTKQDATEFYCGDVQMRSSSDSELEMGNQSFCSPCKFITCFKEELFDSEFNTRSSLNSPAVPSGPPDRSSKTIQSGSAKLSPTSPDSPLIHGAFSKRKFFPPSGDVDEGQRKRPCISEMEVEISEVTEEMKI